MDTTILAVSPSCSELLGLGKPADAVSQPLLGNVLRLIDFTAGGGELDEPEVERSRRCWRSAASAWPAG